MDQQPGRDDFDLKAAIQDFRRSITPAPNATLVASQEELVRQTSLTMSSSLSTENLFGRVDGRDCETRSGENQRLTTRLEKLLRGASLGSRNSRDKPNTDDFISSSSLWGLGYPNSPPKTSQSGCYGGTAPRSAPAGSFMSPSLGVGVDQFRYCSAQDPSSRLSGDDPARVGLQHRSPATDRWSSSSSLLAGWESGVPAAGDCLRRRTADRSADGRYNPPTGGSSSNRASPSRNGSFTTCWEQDTSLRGEGEQPAVSKVAADQLSVRPVEQPRGTAPEGQWPYTDYQTGEQNACRPTEKLPEEVPVIKHRVGHLASRLVSEEQPASTGALVPDTRAAGQADDIRARFIRSISTTFSRSELHIQGEEDAGGRSMLASRRAADAESNRLHNTSSLPPWKDYGGVHPGTASEHLLDQPAPFKSEPAVTGKERSAVLETIEATLEVELLRLNNAWAFVRATTLLDRELLRWLGGGLLDPRAGSVEEAEKINDTEMVGVHAGETEEEPQILSLHVEEEDSAEEPTMVTLADVRGLLSQLNGRQQSVQEEPMS